MWGAIFRDGAVRATAGKTRNLKQREAKLCHKLITYLYTFSLHSCAFQFMSSITLKLFTFYVFTLYFTDDFDQGNCI
jgi:hypothetical protein